MSLEAQEYAKASSSIENNSSFPHFQKLHSEIQNLIWEWTLPYSRVHYVESIEFIPALVNPQGRYLNIKCPPVPIAFSVSRKSRYVASLHMTRFSLNTAFNLDRHGIIPYGYCGPYDTLYIEKMFQSQQKWKLGNNPFFTMAYGLQINGMMQAPLIEFPAYRDLFAGFTPSQNITLVKIEEIEGFDDHRYCSRVLPADTHCSFGIGFDETYQAVAFERDLEAWREEQAVKAMRKGKTMPEIKIAEMALACECADVKEKMEEKVSELNRAAMSETLE
ncbi:uncharacterized protein BKA55DRAFT_544139 [Fusarium redolens]|uniref:2EXR domain-containing protein n=1 Tax=Fusarium redolens TaxID=48865 RepID=A0A9P9GBZ4_FUSRE|nr:uncharacterized protein BKA55DRAFT_544139 [Fusarium redolens]KAH7234952.1 hypothetical protein BKA55DRAFT_544139 [Fusarium redolens]